MSTLTSATSPTKFSIILLMSSLAFVVALSWDSLIQTIINKYAKKGKDLKGATIYTAIVTGLMIGLAYLVANHYPDILSQISL